MAKIRVDEIANRSSEQASEAQAPLRRRKDLHKTSQFERQRPEAFAGIGHPDLTAVKSGAATAPARVERKSIVYALPGGEELQIPQLSDVERAKAEAALAKLSPEGRARVVQSAEELGAATWDEVENQSEGLKVGSFSAGYSDAANAAYEVYAATTGEDDRNKVTEDLLFVGMSGVESNLVEFYNDVKGRADLGNEAKADAAELEAMLADWPAGKDTQLFSWREIIANPDGSVKVVEHKNEALTKEQAQELLGKLKAQSDTMDTITSQDTFKLQMKVQKYQEAMTSLSNIIKSQDDTRKAIIANAKAS
jgi:hypothetical protein